MCFPSVEYGDSIPTSEELQHALGCTEKEERNQCALLHLDAALTRSEVGSNKPHPPGRRARLVAKGLRLLEDKQAVDVRESLPS